MRQDLRFRAIAGGLSLALLCTAAPAQQPPAPAVTVEAAVITDLRPRVSFSGRLVAAQKVEIRARVTGFVEEIAFEEGSRVSQGNALYVIEDDAYRAAVDEIAGSIAAAEAELRLAEIERDRKRQLVERQTVAQSELDIAEANLGKVEGQIRQLTGSLSRAELELTYTQITAPFDGMVGLSSVDVGALVGPESGPLTTLTRLNPMTVEFPVTTAELLRYRAEAAGRASGSEAAVEIVQADGSIYPQKGRIDFVDAEVAGGTDTVLVRAVFDNEGGDLLDGALVTVALERSEERPVLNVPRRAVQRDQAGDFVLVVDEASTVELRRVTLADTIEGRAVIEGGLEEGERVITDGVNKVRPGITVDAATAGSDG